MTDPTEIRFVYLVRGCTPDYPDYVEVWDVKPERIEGEGVVVWIAVEEGISALIQAEPARAVFEAYGVVPDNTNQIIKAPFHRIREWWER